ARTRRPSSACPLLPCAACYAHSVSTPSHTAYENQRHLASYSSWPWQRTRFGLAALRRPGSRSTAKYIYRRKCKDSTRLSETCWYVPPLAGNHDSYAWPQDRSPRDSQVAGRGVQGWRNRAGFRSRLPGCRRPRGQSCSDGPFNGHSGAALGGTFIDTAGLDGQRAGWSALCFSRLCSCRRVGAGKATETLGDGIPQEQSNPNSDRDSVSQRSHVQGAAANPQRSYAVVRGSFPDNR